MSICVSISECADQTYNVEVNKTALVRCGYNSSADYPSWSFSYPNSTLYRLNSNERFNPNLPSFDRIYWVDKRHLEIRSVTKEDQGFYQCAVVGFCSWFVQLTAVGNLF